MKLIRGTMVVGLRPCNMGSYLTGMGSTIVRIGLRASAPYIIPDLGTRKEAVETAKRQRTLGVCFVGMRRGVGPGWRI